MSIIGIDLGTTNSLVSVWKDDKCVLIPNTFGSYTTPSVVSIDQESGTIYVGEIAAKRRVTYPNLTAEVFKRSMGTRKIYHLGEQSFYPEELSAFVLRRLKEDAEEFLGEPVTEAIISVPAYFNDMARNATKRAGEIAGLQVERIINEPSAAALACQHKTQQEDAMVLVFDLGGGTLDVSLVECFENVLNILAVSGDNYLGGRDFDRILAELFCQEKGLVFKDLDSKIQAVLLESGERCKQQLTNSETAAMIVKCDEIDEQLVISNEQLAQASASLFSRMEKPVRKVLLDAGVDAAELTDVVLVGGSCKMPLIHQYLHYLLMRGVETMDPDYIIAKGVGICAGIKERNAEIKDMLLTDICPFSLGIGIINRDDLGKDIMSVIINRNASLPTSKVHRYVTTSDGQTQLETGIYQGENYYVKDNLKLAQLQLEVPPAPKGEIEVDVRFTYDINGVLEVNAHVLKTGVTKQLIVVNKDLQITQEELDQKLKAFEKMKISPRDQESNKLLLSQGEQLFTRASEPLRSEIASRVQYFEHLLGMQDEFQIRKMYKHIQEFFDMVQNHLDALIPSSALNTFTQNWYRRDPDRSIVENFEEWRKKNNK